MSYEITVQIPDGKYCMTIKNALDYALCPFLVTIDDSGALCPFKQGEYLANRLRVNEVLNQVDGGIIKGDFCPSYHRVGQGEMDFWTFQKLQEIKQRLEV